jgi:hypothetical protein
MTAQEFTANLEGLIANARHEGLPDEDMIHLLREAVDAMEGRPPHERRRGSSHRNRLR